MNKEKKKEFRRIVEAYLNGNATAQQEVFLKQYFDIFSASPDILEDQSLEEINSIKARLLRDINVKISVKEHKPIFRRWLYSSAAAVLVLISLILLYNLRTKYERSFSHQYEEAQVLSIGRDEAILTLSDGKKVKLDSKTNAKIKDLSTTINNNNKRGELSYDVSKNSESHNLYNKIKTPRGGQYRLTLSDGTKVWLNAESSLSYPISFSESERVVELQGEAYFEVAHNKSAPFKVINKDQIAEVLGTHFNISAYADDALITTTLLEGKLRVISRYTGSRVIIDQGDQCSISTTIGESIPIVRKVDVDEAIAWKNGYFMFDNESLESILHKVSRWYDAHIVFSDLEVGKQKFSGTLSRYSDINTLLKKLELTGSVHFKIKERRIIVSR